MDEYAANGGKVTRKVGRNKKPGPKKATKKATPKIHVGPSGGKYYVRKGRKVYV